MDIKPHTPDFTHGACTGMPNGIYHASKSVSLSKLKMYLDDPLKYQGMYITGEMERPESDALRKGSAHHAWTLEGPEVFNQEFSCVDNLAFKSGADKWESIMALNETLFSPFELDDLKGMEKLNKPDIINFFVSHPGKARITKDEVETVKLVDAAIKSHPLASVLLAEGLPEVSFRSEVSKGLGYSIQCRTDWLNVNGCKTTQGISYMVDLKTVESLERWDKNYYDFGYYLQWPYYCETMKAAFGERIAKLCFFIVAETKWPYRVRVRTPDVEDWGLAMAQITKGFKGIAASLKSKNWNEPGWDQLQVQSLKPWARRNIEESSSEETKSIEINEQLAIES